MRMCPKCRGIPVSYIELWKNHAIEFDVNENGIVSSEGCLSDGYPYCVEAICRECGHRWRLRGVTQIVGVLEMQ